MGVPELLSDHLLPSFSGLRASKIGVGEVQQCRYGSLPPAVFDGLGGVAADAVGAEPLMATCGLIAGS